MTPIDPQQIRLAADIIEARKAGREPKWDVRGNGNLADIWFPHEDKSSPLKHILSGFTIRLTPWTLPPCPVEGRQWHREKEWKEDMLEGGWRPVMVGEITQKGDEVWANGSGPWDSVLKGTDVSPAMVRIRTRRPALPVQPVVRAWNCPSDVPGPVCWLKSNIGRESMVLEVYHDGVMLNDGADLAWSKLANWQYSTTRNGADWHPCTVEAQP